MSYFQDVPKSTFAAMGISSNLEEMNAKYSGDGGCMRSALIAVLATNTALVRSRGVREKPAPEEWLYAEHLAVALGIKLEEARWLDSQAPSAERVEAQWRLCRNLQVRVAAASAISWSRGPNVSATNVGSAIEQAASSGRLFDQGYRMSVAPSLGRSEPIPHTEIEYFRSLGGTVRDPMCGLGQRFEGLLSEEFKAAEPVVGGLISLSQVPNPE
ncbi:hypothetical protein [Cupriavidus metallidurans]|uniref:hypothetical protein n=1 Tax=Cupriavidus metallidurans TaxID=119219 RepID=UPI00164449D9|nr:hypothetical protein [Cupriavidus metallidurans]